MHKLFVAFIALIFSSFITTLIVISIAKADEAGTWINASLAVQKEADTLSLPSTLNGGNIDCTLGSSDCFISTPYGTFANSAIYLNGSSKSIPLLSYLENRQRVLLIPNSTTVISSISTPVFGLYLYFNNYLSVTKTLLPGTTQDALRINRPPDGRLADKSNNRLSADTESMSFSSNGQWMVVSIPNVAVARVDMQTFEVLPFGTKFDYGLGLAPSPKTAITNDGRYAVVASRDFNTFRIYDLSTCGPVPNTIVRNVNCQSRDLRDFMTQQIPGYSFVAQARFLAEDTLGVYAGYKIGSISKTARFIISTSDISSQIEYLALGDSYISGEGAYEYQGGTDTATNHCHLSLISYPYLLGRNLDYSSYHSVACSGAVMDDITNSSGTYTGQVDNRKGLQRKKRPPEDIDSIFASFKPGYINQSDFVSRYRPKVINLSIGGNDIGFSDIVIKCAAFWNLDNCYESYEDRLELVRLINSKFPTLVDTYTKIKSRAPPDGLIYIVGYPQIAKPGGDCAFNVHLSDNEAQFSQQLIDYLDTVIKAAADRVGVFYVDVQDALNGHRLCEATESQVAMNGLTAGTDSPNLLWDLLHGPIGNESYHPNALGHQLLKDKVLAATENLTRSMPAPNPNVGPPSENGLEILNVSRQNRQINTVQYDDTMINDILFRGTSSEMTVDGIEHSLSPGASYKVELRSSPINLGNFTTDSFANLSSPLQIPVETPIGLHTLHIYGSNIAGENIDIYKNVYVADSLNDFNGDGVLNADEACLVGEPSGIDYDQDGIDDACDGTIGQPPPIQVALSGTQAGNGQSQNQSIVLGSTTTGGTQPPVSSTTSSIPFDVNNTGNADKDVVVAVQSATTTKLGTSPNRDNGGLSLGLENLKSWPGLAAIFAFVVGAFVSVWKLQMRHG